MECTWQEIQEKTHTQNELTLGEKKKKSKLYVHIASYSYGEVKDQTNKLFSRLL